jgi:hypothetical protein
VLHPTPVFEASASDDALSCGTLASELTMKFIFLRSTHRPALALCRSDDDGLIQHHMLSCCSSFMSTPRVCPRQPCRQHGRG